MYKNILVNSLVNIGDVILTTSAIALLKKIYPEARITMMVRPVAAQLVQNNPIIDDVIIFDYKAKQKSTATMIVMVKEVRSRKFDACISFDRKLRPALLMWLARIPVRVVPNRVFDDKPSWVTKLFTHVVKIEHDLKENLQAETYQAIIRGFTGQAGTAKPVLARIMPQNEKKALELISNLPLSDYRVALCIKGTFPLKTWPKESFAQLVAEINNRYNCSFFIIGAPEDREYADETIKIMPVPVANYCGETNLVDLSALLQKTNLFITVDTGATHIAATVDVPMVVVYGCTSPKRWRPLTANAVTITSNEKCCPCSVRVEDCPEPMCLKNIKLEDVLAPCIEHLKGNIAH